MALPASALLRFSARFVLGTTPTLTLTDLIASYTGTTITGWFEVTDPDGLMFHQGTQASPDVGNTSPLTWAVSSITLPLDADGVHIKSGTYTFTYYVKSDSYAAVSVTKTYDFDYTSPTVEIQLTASCRTSELTSEDITDYYFYTGSTISPATLTRSHTITKPAGSSANDPGTLTGVSLYASRTIGGGTTSATRLWTRIWQTTISTNVVYNVSTWDSYTWVIIDDTVTGSDSIDVRCTDCACVLNTCWENLVTRWKDAESNHSKNVFDLRYKVAYGASLWTEYYNRERCGEDSTEICQDIEDLLDSEDCSCSDQSDDAASVVVVPWGASSSSTTPSTFAFHKFTSTPTTEGQAGDWGIYTVGTTNSYLYYNNAGTWQLIIDLKGTSGSSTSATPVNILYNNYANVGTSAGVTLETLDTYTLTAGIFATAGDILHIEAVLQLGANDNGKTMYLYFGGTQLCTFYTESLINTSNNIVKLEAWITYEAASSETLETLVTTNSSTIPTFSTIAVSTTPAIAITVQAQNSVAAASDIICKKFRIERFNIA